jgi:hypothetical protein
MFINLSNHPSSKWDKKQIEAASAFGDIYDLPFPNVDPSGDENYILSIAKNCIADIKAVASKSDSAVLVAGEQSLAFCLVQQLQAKGWICLCATSQRIITQKADNTKEIKFVFERFRRFLALKGV